MSLFSRYCAWRQTHPMSGGVRRVRLDRGHDYLSLRERTFGFRLAPLPRSLELPAAERLLQLGRQAPAIRSATVGCRMPNESNAEMYLHPLVLAFG